MSAAEWAERLGRETLFTADRWRLAIALLPEPLQEDQRVRDGLVQLGTIPGNTPEGAAKALLKVMADHAESRSGVVFGTGEQQFVDQSRMERLDDVLEREAATAVKMERHLWIVLMAHRGTDKMLDAWDKALVDPDSPPTLDADTLMANPALACYVCDVAYEPRLRRRKCPGETRWVPVPR